MKPRLVGLGALSVVACTGEDVVARKLVCAGDTCASTGCEPRVCEDSEAMLCRTAGWYVQAGDSCDASGQSVRRHALCSCSDVTSQAPVRISGDPGSTAVRVSVAGRIAAEAPFVVDGRLTYGSELADPTQVRADSLLNTETSCSCDEASQLDIPALVGRIASRTASVADLDGFSTDTRYVLPCGIVLLNRIAGSADLTLVAEAHTVLVVDGNVELDRALRVQVRSGARLELVLRGTLRVGGTARLGDPEGQFALSTGATGTLDLGGSLALYGSLYAPDAELVLRGTSEVHGSLFVRRLISAGELSLYAAGADEDFANCASTALAASSPLFTASGMPTPR
ncbi:MAG: hypothetical protein RL385_2396 [Pseudomonadota bacterium]